MLASAWKRVAHADLARLRLTWIANRGLAKRLLGDIGGAIEDVLDVGTFGGYEKLKDKTEDILDYGTFGGYTKLKDTITDDGGTVAAEEPPDITTDFTIGGQLDTPGSMFTEEEEESKLKGISKKRMGTRGLQIPLVADTSTTTPITAAEGGIQI